MSKGMYKMRRFRDRIDRLRADVYRGINDLRDGRSTLIDDRKRLFEVVYDAAKELELHVETRRRIETLGFPILSLRDLDRIIGWELVIAKEKERSRLSGKKHPSVGEEFVEAVLMARKYFHLAEKYANIIIDLDDERVIEEGETDKGNLVAIQLLESLQNSTPEERRATLRAAGIITADGALAPEYRPATPGRGATNSTGPGGPVKRRGKL